MPGQPYPRGVGNGIVGTWPRLYTRIVRRNVITTVPSCLKPVVSISTMPIVGLDFDSRVLSTFDWAYTVSPSNSGDGIRTSSQPRLTALRETSATERPVTSAIVKHEFMSGRPNSVCDE